MRPAYITSAEKNQRVNIPDVDDYRSSDSSNDESDNDMRNDLPEDSTDDSASDSGDENDNGDGTIRRYPLRDRIPRRIPGAILW